MIAHLARLAGTPGLPTLRPLRQGLAEGQLDVDEGAGCKPTTALQPSDNALPQTRREGRIHENKIEGARVRRARPRQPGERIGANHLDLRRLQPFNVLLKCRDATRIGVKQGCGRSPTRAGLEAERTTAGEQIEHVCTANMRSEPVEQCLPDAIGCGPDGGRLRETQPSTTPDTGDDADLVGGGAASRGHLRRRVA